MEDSKEQSGSNNALNPDAVTFVPIKKDDTISDAAAVNDNAEHQEPTVVNAMDIDADEQDAEFHFDPLEHQRKMLKFQLEFHFSDLNLAMDNYMVKHMHMDPGYWLSLEFVSHIKKIRHVTEDIEMIKEVIKQDIDTLELNEDETKVRRVKYVPPKPQAHRNLRRTVFIYGFAPKTNEDQIKDFCAYYGTVKHVIMETNEKQLPNLDLPFQHANDDDDEQQQQPKQKENDDQMKKPNVQMIPRKQDGMNEVFLGSALEMPPRRKSSEIIEAELADTYAPEKEVANLIMSAKFGPPPTPTLTATATAIAAGVESPASMTGGRRSSMATLTVETEEGPQRMVVDIKDPPSSRNLSNIIGPMHMPHPIPHPNGDPHDFSHLVSAFVVFDTQGQANKCVRSLFRSNTSGIRSMHQYDFNKARKKIFAAKARMITPLFSPLLRTHSSSTTMMSNNNNNNTTMTPTVFLPNLFDQNPLLNSAVSFAAHAHSPWPSFIHAQQRPRRHTVDGALGSSFSRFKANKNRRRRSIGDNEYYSYNQQNSKRARNKTCQRWSFTEDRQRRETMKPHSTQTANAHGPPNRAEQADQWRRPSMTKGSEGSTPSTKGPTDEYVVIQPGKKLFTFDPESELMEGNDDEELPKKPSLTGNQRYKNFAESNGVRIKQD